MKGLGRLKGGPEMLGVMWAGSPTEGDSGDLPGTDSRPNRNDAFRGSLHRLQHYQELG